ncbi:M57 family metalloprotease [Pyxidicoccus trucidator]|uniref:M57 family metalloprotease n=1 Tax=Pyxidicoccus trucidator TaxID=2709662 RepID=UPI0023DD806C|nr:M57 family metalloprotease [Pyxidicoccus trucidator]
MLARSLVLAAGCVALVFGCAEPPDETQEIVSNLVNAGFPADDVMVVDGKVYVGRDVEVSLTASRELLETGETTEEQYRTTNLISTALTKICINGSTFTGAFSTALDLAIQNYDELPLTFAMARTPSTGCSFTINAVIQPGVVGGSAGFPSGGLPYSTINIGGGLSSYSVDVIEHVITHEIGHTLGFRHTDYYNRSISCGSGGNEGDAGVGAIHIPGTPTTATVGSSLMNSCFRSVETGEFAPGDLAGLRTLYTPAQDTWQWCNKCQGLFYAGNPSSSCPAGGVHGNSGSYNYHLAHDVAPTAGWQGDWRWCNKCQGLFYGGNAASSVCPSGGTHDGSGSYDYHLHHSAGGAPDLQSNWRWCNKCQGLFYGGSASSACPAGGAHYGGSSYDYSLIFR